MNLSVIIGGFLAVAVINYLRPSARSQRQSKKWAKASHLQPDTEVLLSDQSRLLFDDKARKMGVWTSSNAFVVDYPALGSYTFTDIGDGKSTLNLNVREPSPSQKSVAVPTADKAKVAAAFASRQFPKLAA